MNQGVSRQRAVLDFIGQLARDGVMMHGFLLAHRGRTLAEGYYAPFDSRTPHRLFSVSKTATGLAVGLLYTDGALKLEDRIVSFFPDKLPGDIKPWMAEMTLHNLLRMATCFDRTAFNSKTDTDWVAGFFRAEPLHKPGTVFSYDTSATHTLGALVERLSGDRLLGFLEKRLFGPLGMDGQKRWLRDPMGICQAGSGLVMTLRDLSLLAGFLLGDGGGLISRDFLDRMRSVQITTIQRKIPEERHGYGYQIWHTREGLAMLGMGGQLAIILPGSGLTLCTIADTQLDPLGMQHIFDAFYAHLRRVDQAPSDPEDQQALDAALRALRCPAVAQQAPANPARYGGYRLNANAMGMQSLEFDGSRLVLMTASERLEIGYGQGSQALGSLRGQPFMASGGWQNEHAFYLRGYWIGDTPCGFDALLSFQGPDLTLRLTRAADPLSEGLEGQCSGRLQDARDGGAADED